jgi:hypothetical protein
VDLIPGDRRRGKHRVAQLVFPNLSIAISRIVPGIGQICQAKNASTQKNLKNVLN